METTLLVLEMVNDSEVGPVVEEEAVLQELADMESAGPTGGKFFSKRESVGGVGEGAQIAG